MTEKTPAVYALYPQSIALNELLQTLSQGGFDKESICMMIAPTHPVAEMMREANTHSLERGTQAASAGLIGWLSEFGAVLIPTFGFFVRSREFFHALVVEQDSIAYCGRHGTLVALGSRRRTRCAASIACAKPGCCCMCLAPTSPRANGRSSSCGHGARMKSGCSAENRKRRSLLQLNSARSDGTDARRSDSQLCRLNRIQSNLHQGPASEARPFVFLLHKKIRTAYAVRSR